MLLCVLLFDDLLWVAETPRCSRACSVVTPLLVRMADNWVLLVPFAHIGSEEIKINKIMS